MLSTKLRFNEYKCLIDQKDEGTLDARRRDGGTNFILRIKEQETRLTLHEHDDDYDYDEVFYVSFVCKIFILFLYFNFLLRLCTIKQRLAYHQCYVYHSGRSHESNFTFILFYDFLAYRQLYFTKFQVTTAVLLTIHAFLYVALRRGSSGFSKKKERKKQNFVIFKRQAVLFQLLDLNLQL